jgi:hypothetical protein
MSVTPWARGGQSDFRCLTIFLTGGDFNAESAPVGLHTAEVSRMTPVPMDHHEKMRLRAAAFRVTRLYPGPVGELLSRELLTWEEFGYRLGGGQLVMRLVDHVLKTPLVQAEAA